VPTSLAEAGYVKMRILLLAMLTFAVIADDATSLTTSTIAGVEILTVAIPPGWSSAIVMSADREHFLEQQERVLINGGYFDPQGQPSGLLIIGKDQTGRLRHDKPYSGFLWSDAAGVLHIAQTADPPADAAWAIQSGPLLVEAGRAAINSGVQVAPRSVIAIRHGRVLVIRTGGIGLKELADGLVEKGIEMAINLDGGPSSVLMAHIAGQTLDRPGTAKVPYFLGFAPRAP